MFRISCFADEISDDLNDQFRVLKELGMKCMEIRTANDIPVLSFSDKTAKEIRQMADENGIEITCVSSSIGKTAITQRTEDACEQVRRAAEIAHIFGCKFIRIFSFFRVDDMSEEEMFNAAAEKLSAMAKEAEKENVVLVMEGGHNTIGNFGYKALKLFQAVNSPSLRCAFDAAAFFAEGDKPYEDALPLLLPYIEYMHMKDAKSGAAGRVVVGEGDAKIKEILTEVKSKLPEKDLVLSLEPHLSYAGATRGFTGEEPFKKAFKALDDMLSEI